MATHQQAQQQPQPQRHKGLPWKYVRRIIYILVIITLLFFMAGGTIWVLIQVGLIKASWSDKLFTILTGLGGANAVLLAIFSIFQFILYLIPNIPESPIPSLSSSSPTANQSNVSTTPSTPVSTPPPNKASYRGIIGLPPPTDPRTIQQREQVVIEVYTRLTQPGIAAIALTGIGGIGKSTLAALIYRYAEDQRHTHNSPFNTEPLWLTINPAVTMTDLAGTLVEALGKPMLDLATLSPQNQAATLFNALNTVDKPRLIILDQFENLLDWQTGQALPDRIGVGEWLDALNSQPCLCRVLLTSRPDPKGTREYPPTCLQTYPVEGLAEAEGIELLRKQGVTGTETELRTAVIGCDGHAFSLTLLASLLRARKLSLTTLLQDSSFAHLWTGKVAQNLLDSIYIQLDETQRNLLVAFSVFREPLPLEAVQAIIDAETHVSKAQLESALDALLAQHLLQASEGGFYQLHVIVASYAQSHVIESNEQANRLAMKAVHARAGQYYKQRAATSCPPREKRHQISDVHDLIEAVWQYCQAEQWQKAYSLIMQEGLFHDLYLWGGNTILLELYQLLLPPDKWHTKRLQVADIYNELGLVCKILGQLEQARRYFDQELDIYKKIRSHWYNKTRSYWGEGWVLHNLGQVYSELGQMESARRYYEQALSIHKKVGNRRGEGATLNNLGIVYNSLGETERARSYYQQALALHRKVDDRKEEGVTLNNLGIVYNSLGETARALSYYQDALSIHKEVGNRLMEGVTLNNLGIVYNSLGETARALSYYQQALAISKEVGNRIGEGNTLRNIGVLYFKLSRYDFALACFLLARGMFEEVQSPKRDQVQRRIDDLQEKVSKKRFDALLSQVEPQATQIVEQAFREGIGQV